MATVGKNILDNLTTGMYSDSKVIYREYIQNACDQIDKAIKYGLLQKNEGLVDIYIDRKKRYISITDNATGVKEDSFVSDLGDIANSNKQRGEDKGFRGIGRLCGLAYCKTLKFCASYFGETVKSVMVCNAKKMREMLAEDKKYTLDEICVRPARIPAGGRLQHHLCLGGPQRPGQRQPGRRPPETDGHPVQLPGL